MSAPDLDATRAGLPPPRRGNLKRHALDAISLSAVESSAGVLPCPCGVAATVAPTPNRCYDGSVGMGWQVECDGCGWRGPWRLYRAAAVADWNEVMEAAGSRS